MTFYGSADLFNQDSVLNWACSELICVNEVDLCRTSERGKLSHTAPSIISSHILEMLLKLFFCGHKKSLFKTGVASEF